ncbi:hypothetical protein [Hymenobacter actinosclerus]|uniref:hypothetical protein n=1 Tax=Hymenobacter actinosclerus TaxID=82805 RepID=UPI001160B42C|nr:hypothetical protein [Hymenobacter actinosclerus]
MPAEGVTAPTISRSFEKPAPTPVPADTATPRPVPNPAIEAEQITYKMLVFFGLPSEQITVSQLTRQLGQPDSVARGAVECGSQLSDDLPLPGDMWYYGGTQYEVAGNQAALGAMDVRNGRFSGKLGKLVLNQHTTLQDVARVFPNAVRSVRPAAMSAALQEISFTYLMGNGETADGTLNLIFDRGKLILVEHWFPC